MLPTPTTRHAIYAATAQFGGKDAGHVCYGRTADEARAKAKTRTTMSVVVKRELLTAPQLAALGRAGKL